MLDKQKRSGENVLVLILAGGIASEAAGNALDKWG
jgi:hypothetical protein